MQAVQRHPNDITPKMLFTAFPRLSRAESEVLNLIIQAKSNGEIATILDCATDTVAKHVTHILHKLGVENRGAAMLEAIRVVCFGDKPTMR